MKEEKNKHSVRLSDEAWSMVENEYKNNRCTTKNEYIEKTIRFYTGYLHTQSADLFLPDVLTDVLQDKLGALGQKIGSLLFKLTVDVNMMAHIIACDTDIDLETLDRLRARCVRDAKDTHGKFSFKDALIFQKSL